MLVKWVTFLYTLNWPLGGVDLGVGGVSYVELLIFYELWAGERLSLEKAHPRYLRPGRPISYCRLRHIGWERCGHGLTSRPRESSSVPFLNELLRLFGYHSGSAGALFCGTLPLRYCTTRFASRIPTWRLPVPGHAAALVTSDDEVPGSLGIEVSGRRVFFLC